MGSPLSVHPAPRAVLELAAWPVPDPAIRTPLADEDRYSGDPGFFAVPSDSEVPERWLHSDTTRLAVRSVNDTDPSLRRGARESLATGVSRQVPDFDLFREAMSREKAINVILLLVFPGSTADNTGTKDLNDKVLGYSLTSEYIRKRNAAIDAVFEAEGFVMIDQDFKSSGFVPTAEASRHLLDAGQAQKKRSREYRERFDRGLSALDGRLRDLLLDILQNRFDEIDETHREAARTLRDRLLEDADHRFDVTYGMANPAGRGATSQDIYPPLLLAKLNASKASYTARRRDLIDSLLPGWHGSDFDRRGYAFDPATYQRLSVKAGEIRDEIRRHLDGQITVDGVRARVFVRVRGKLTPNRHVMRDARKGKIKPPDPSPEKDQLERIEGYRAIVNTMDVFESFLSGELDGEKAGQLRRATRLHEKLGRMDTDIGRGELSRVLDVDVRMERIALANRTSEYLFFTEAADHRHRVIVGLDIRDLGVDALIEYARAVDRVAEKPGTSLLAVTLEANDPILAMKRHAVDLIVDAYGKMASKLLAADVGWLHDAAEPYNRAWAEAYGYAGGFDILADPLDRSESPNYLIGGDEVILALPPAFLPLIPEFLGRVCPPSATNTRGAVVFSDAGHPPDADPAVQRRLNQHAHATALTAADKGPDILKDLERDHWRLGRKIEKIDDDAERREKQRRLAGLGLLRLYVEIPSLYGIPDLLPSRVFIKDFSGTKRSFFDLKRRIAELEKELPAT